MSGLPERSVILAEDETDLLLFPPLRAMWSPRGQPAQVMLSGRNVRRVVFGAMNLITGHRLFLMRERQYANDFQAFLREVRRHYRGWHVVLLLDSDPSHTAHASQALARRLGLRLLWLPKQYANIDEQAEVFIAHLRSLSNKDALRTSGVLSNHFWLKHALSK